MSSEYNHCEHKYVHINSSHKNDKDETSNFSVRIPEPIRNCKRVALKSFSFANTAFNVRNHKTVGNQETPAVLEWVEFHRVGTDTTTHLFEIELTQGYTTTAELVNEFNTKAAALAARAYSGTTAMTLTMSKDPTTHIVELVVDSGTDEKFFAPVYTDGRANYWNKLGFGLQKLIHLGGNKEDTAKLESFVDKFHLQKIKYARSSEPESDRTITAGHEPTLENISGLFVCSDALTNGDNYETHRNNDNNEAKRTNILDWVVNDQPRFSYIHYKANTPHWNTVRNETITEFDVQLKDDDGVLFSSDSLREYQMVLVFETEHHPDYSKQFLITNNNNAYRAAHPTRVTQF